MKQFEVKALGLEEVSFEEAKTTNGGGGLLWKIITAVVGAVVYCYENWEELEEASREAKNDYATDNQ